MILPLKVNYHPTQKMVIYLPRNYLSQKHLQQKDTQYLFEAIPKTDNISSLNDLLILPSSERAIIHYLDSGNINIDYNTIKLNFNIIE